MKYLITVLLALYLISCSSSNKTDKNNYNVQEVIENYINRYINDPSTYQFVEMAIVDTVTYERIISTESNKEELIEKLDYLNKTPSDIAFIKVNFAHREANRLTMIQLQDKIYHLKEIDGKLEVIWGLHKETNDMAHELIREGTYNEHAMTVINELEGNGWSSIRKEIGIE